MEGGGLRGLVGHDAPFHGTGTVVGEVVRVLRVWRVVRVRRVVRVLRRAGGVGGGPGGSGVHPPSRARAAVSRALPMLEVGIASTTARRSGTL
ncbi:hypothetical protein Kpho01_74610 [Kitasatospora phosalacinea]|uniref:Uncharacterized protein n=1 Tax=Kitasatospora phosalacinea TaxID=2065 RepID=A0A9W6PQU8_9ACTN|nr:hypothetical protein Kpho01_74610 [Kitasatospora phosalacinea]